jgi:hypothetical protein
VSASRIVVIEIFSPEAAKFGGLFLLMIVSNAGAVGIKLHLVASAHSHAIFN